MEYSKYLTAFKLENILICLQDYAAINLPKQFQFHDEPEYVMVVHVQDLISLATAHEKSKY